MKLDLPLRRCAALFVSLVACQPAFASSDTIEEIIVTASFRDRPATEIPASITVLDADAVQELAVQHFEELIGVVPNLNWSGDGHRARYLQIRGVGELEQYQGAPNPSVGFLVDDIDFSGIGTIATLFDIGRVEVLRGPQGTRYGANALAGLVYVQSEMPTADWVGRVQLTAADDDALAGGAAVGGPVTADGSLRFRVSAHHFTSNGFRDNAYLGRGDTNGRDETTVRGRVSWLPSDTATIEFATFFADIDNGYDAFAIDNSLTRCSRTNRARMHSRAFGASLRVGVAGGLVMGVAYSSITVGRRFRYRLRTSTRTGATTTAGRPLPTTTCRVSDQLDGRTFSQEIPPGLDVKQAGSSAVTRQTGSLGIYLLDLEDDLLTTLNQGEYYRSGLRFCGFSLDDSVREWLTRRSNIAAFGQLDTEPSRSATRLTASACAWERRNTDYVDSGRLADRARPRRCRAGRSDAEPRPLGRP